VKNNWFSDKNVKSMNFQTRKLKIDACHIQKHTHQLRIA